MITKNDIIISEIEALGFNGEGITHFDGTTIFVPFALVGEKVEMKILKVKGSIAFAKVQKLLSSSKDRVEPVCPVFGKCGGCDIQHLNYDGQLQLKQSIVKDCFKKIADIDFEIDKTVASPLVLGYRNKLQLPVRCVNGEIKIGFFREASHDVVDIDACPLHEKWAEKLIAVFRRFFNDFKISCFDEATSKGLVKHIVARFSEGKILIALVLTNAKLPHLNELIERLSAEFEKFSLVLNVNKLNNNVIFGKEFLCVFGDGKIKLDEFGINYETGIDSFMQVNDGQKHNLYQTAFVKAQVDENTTVIDGYSGAGVLTAMFAKKAKMAFGVEIIKGAVESADRLAKENGLEDKMKNVCGDCAEELPKIIESVQKTASKTVLILDPPRKGVEYSVLQSALKCQPDRIVYISCSPQTLARDIGMLVGTLKNENGAIVKNQTADSIYSIDSITPFDMFPNTRHVETIVSLSKTI